MALFKLVEPETKLAIGLRFLAGGDPLDLKLIYDVSKDYIYKTVCGRSSTP